MATSNKKLIIITIVFSILLLAGAVIFLNSSGSSKAKLEKVLGAKFETEHYSYDLQTIPYSGGSITHSYTIKNSGSAPLKLANMATSCMCTQTYFKKGEIESPRFGMKGMSRQSNWSGELAPGERAEVVAVFDPAFHGPTGVGKMERVVSFETNDPDKPYIELEFKGEVIK